MLGTCTKSPDTAGFAAGAALPVQWGGQLPGGNPPKGTRQPDARPAPSSDSCDPGRGMTHH